MKAILSLPTTGPAWDAVGNRTIAGYMTGRLPAVYEYESVMLCWELLRRTQVPYLPVIAPNGACLGILDQTTLAVAFAHDGLRIADGPVGDLLPGRAVRSILRTDTLASAVRAMADDHVDVLAVIDHRGVLHGLLTSADVIAALAGRHHSPARVTETVPMLYRMEPAPPRPEPGG